ncbi:MAG: 2-hydroxyacyl-CoA dehydratase family protein [Peptococcaceae bacterium]|nr:2-hydroxyacyl-CoA dehydratase family protein [Peptococcaceae bacterium]
MLKRLMSEYYAKGTAAREEGIPVVWVTAVFPVEIIYAAGLFPYYPENFGALAAARKVADQLSVHAEARGYYFDLCGYARCGLGDIYAADHPVGKIEPPDMVFCCNTQCGSLPKWFQTAGRYYKVPYFLLDSPMIESAPTTLAREYFMEQLKEMIDFLEVRTGNPFDFSRLAETMALSDEACRLWNDILDTAALRPAPFGFFDACFHMAPIVTMRGTKEAVLYYRALKDEVEKRAARKIYAVPGEKYKIYWDHIPVWPKLRWFADYFASRGALVAASQYTHSWAYSFDTSRPLESLAENYSGAFVNRGFDKRVQMKISFINRYKIDGFVLFSNKSCKPNSFGLYDKSKEISQLTGIPGVVIEGDMSDLRFFSEEQVKGKLDVLFDLMKKDRG